MPIYEFYCSRCHTVYSFLAGPKKGRRKPDCPVCGQAHLERRPSRFAVLRGVGEGSEGEEDDLFSHLDEHRLETAMETLSGEIERMGDQEDPRAIGHMLRRFSDLTGLELGGRMQDALARMEAGEDPDSIEADADDESDDASVDDLFRLKKGLMRAAKRPRVDDNLYFL